MKQFILLLTLACLMLNGQAQNSSPHNRKLATIWLDKGNEHNASNKCNEAIEDFNKAISFDYNFADAYTGRGLAKYKLGQYKEALTDFDIAIRYHPKTIHAFLHRADTYIKLGQDDKANDDLYQAITNMYNYAFKLNQEGQCDKALPYLKQAYSIYPKFEGLEVEMGFTYNCLEQYDEAIRVLKKALQTTTNDCLIYKELAFAYLQLEKLEQADLVSKKGISVCANKLVNSELSFNMAHHYFKNKDSAKFKYWSNETKKWAEEGNPKVDRIKKMILDFDKNNRQN